MPLKAINSPLLNFRKHVKSAALAHGFSAPFSFSITNQLDPVLGFESARGGTRVRFNQTLLECPHIWEDILAAVLTDNQPAWRRSLHILEQCASFGAAPVDIPEVEGATSVHHLPSIQTHINQHYFQHTVVASIGWGKQRPRRKKVTAKRRSIRLGSYWPKDKHIRIHPRLNDPNVPSFVVERIVHHEMVHAFLAQVRPDIPHGHGEEFRILEDRFEAASRADEWIEANLSWLVQ